MTQEGSMRHFDSDERVAKASEELFTTLCKWAEENKAEAQFKLGVCYEYGIGTQRSMFDAVKWYRAAGQNGFVNGGQKLEHFSKHGFCLWSNVDGTTDWSLVYTKLIEDYVPGEGQKGFQIEPTSYI